jgi:hypothetical protein
MITFNYLTMRNNLFLRYSFNKYLHDMKKNYFLVFILPVLFSCTGNNINTGPGTLINSRIKKQVMGIAVNYAREKCKDAKQTVLNDGTVKVSDNQITYLIDPATIVTGLIDNDSDEDAIITITCYKGKFQVNPVHLILIKTGRKFRITGMVDTVMKIIRIQDKIIYAEISKYPPDAPAFGCAVCKEVVKYRYMDGTIARTE